MIRLETSKAAISTKGMASGGVTRMPHTVGQTMLDCREEFVDALACSRHEGNPDAHLLQKHDVLDEEREEGIVEEISLDTDHKGVALETVDVAECRADCVDLVVE